MIPPFLDPSASDDLSHGVNFASGGSGILSTTNEGQVTYTYIRFILILLMCV